MDVPPSLALSYRLVTAFLTEWGKVPSACRARTIYSKGMEYIIMAMFLTFPNGPRTWSTN